MRLRYLMIPILIGALMILILEKNITLEDKTITKENKEISYPYFDINEIDNFIKKYINNYVEKENKVIIDYDYINKESNYYITFYKHVIEERKIKNEIDTFLIDTKENKISKIKPITYEYDIIYNKIIDKEEKYIALTFDDGPNYNTNKVLDILEYYNVPATFFILGTNIKGNENILKKIKERGHEIGNHTFNHKILTKLKEEKIKEEIENTSNLIYKVTGTYPTVLRPSYGIVNKKVKELVDYPIIIWDIDTLDWKYKSSTKIAKRVLSKIEDGDIVLMHDVYSSTANALKIIIPELINKGYKFVTVTELFYYKEIELKKGKVYGFA